MNQRKTLVAVLLVLAALCALTSCALRIPAIDTARFLTAAEANGFTVADRTSDAKQELGDDSCREYYLAQRDGFSVHFARLDSVKNAKALFDGRRSEAEQDSGVSVVSVSMAGLNYQKYTTTRNGRYYTMTRVDDTFLYASVDQKDKDAVRSFFDRLGY